jgi:hypothetical protein
MTNNRQFPPRVSLTHSTHMHLQHDLPHHRRHREREKHHERDYDPEDEVQWRCEVQNDIVTPRREAENGVSRDAGQEFRFVVVEVAAAAAARSTHALCC